MYKVLSTEYDGQGYLIRDVPGLYIQRRLFSAVKKTVDAIKRKFVAAEVGLFESVSFAMSTETKG